jgi:hypothetical protein
VLQSNFPANQRRSKFTGATQSQSYIELLPTACSSSRLKIENAGAVAGERHIDEPNIIAGIA